MHADHNIKISLINFALRFQDFCAMAFSNTNSHHAESRQTKVEKSYPIETKKLLDNLCQFPYHSIGAIHLASICAD
ncbi:MAG: hypothetical protein LBJ80_00725 [Rickettsiales bacterium]|jgi:hypothetical protein|nr:hypothetical protein [Rickettsiales bacterium]MDR1260936.1 hypothetical protein [Rickettsiales bacterium]